MILLSSHPPPLFFLLTNFFSYLFIILVFCSLRIFLSNLRDIVRPKRKRNRHFFFDFPFYEFLRLVVETTRSRSWATFASPSFLFLLFPPTNKRQYGTNSVASSLGFVAVPRSEWNSVGLSINHFVVVILCPDIPTLLLAFSRIEECNRRICIYRDHAEEKQDGMLIWFMTYSMNKLQPFNSDFIYPNYVRIISCSKEWKL